MIDDVDSCLRPPRQQNIYDSFEKLRNGQNYTSYTEVIYDTMLYDKLFYMGSKADVSQL